MGRFIRYIHHGRKVFVDVMNKGKHRYSCLCWSCRSFRPGRKDNCPIASMLYVICKLQSLVTPVWECPNFKEGKPLLPKEKNNNGKEAQACS